MTENNLLVYPIRQAVLRDFKLYNGTPTTARELAAISCEPAIIRDRERAVVEINELRLLGYLEPISGFGGEHLRITERGLQQLSREFPQDAFIYGPAAVR